MTPEEVAAERKALKKAGLVHVPTVAELAADGLATAEVVKVGRSSRTVYKVKGKGQKRIDAAMAANAPIIRDLEAQYQAAHKKEIRWRAEAERFARLRNIASKGL